MRISQIPDHKLIPLFNSGTKTSVSEMIEDELRKRWIKDPAVIAAQKNKNENGCYKRIKRKTKPDKITAPKPKDIITPLSLDRLSVLPDEWTSTKNIANIWGLKRQAALNQAMKLIGAGYLDTRMVSVMGINNKKPCTEREWRPGTGRDWTQVDQENNNDYGALRAVAKYQAYNPYLTIDWQSTSQIAYKRGRSVITVRRDLLELYKAGKVERWPHGNKDTKWRLAPK